MPPAGALPITMEELMAFGFTEAQIRSGAIHGDVTVYPVMWQLPKTYRALLEHRTFDDSKGYTISDSADIYGMGTLGELEQSGYQLEGRVSFKGKKYRGFTSSQLIELPDGHLVDIATIFICLNAPK